MWQPFWHPDGAHPTNEEEIAIVERRTFPRWFWEAVEADLAYAKHIKLLAVGDYARSAEPYGAIEITWPGLADPATGEPPAEYEPLRLYYARGDIYIGFDNGPEPVFLWRWEDE